VFDNGINHIPMNSGFKGETRILHSDESGFQRLLEGRISLCRYIGHPLSVFAHRNRRVIPTYERIYSIMNKSTPVRTKIERGLAAGGSNNFFSQTSIPGAQMNAPADFVLPHVKVLGPTVAYREAGNREAPVALFLHGNPR